jgi:hypothetical protein
MRDSAELQRGLDVLAARAQRHLYGWGLLQSLRKTVGTALTLLLCVPMLLLSWQVLRLFDPMFAPAPGVAVAAVLALLPPLLYCAIRMRSALVGRDIERATALALFDRQLGTKDRFTAAQEFLRRDKRTDFEQAALGSAAEHVEQALHAELQPVSKPTISVPRAAGVCAVSALALLLLQGWLGVVLHTGRTGNNRLEPEHMIADDAPQARRQSPQPVPRALSQDRESGGSDTQNSSAQRAQADGEQAGGRGESAAARGSVVASAESSRSASAASGGAGAQEDASPEKFSESSANAGAAAASARQQSDAGASRSSVSGASAAAAGSESGEAASGSSSSGNNGNQNSGQASGEGDAGDTGAQGNQGAGKSGGGGEIPGATNTGVSDGAAPHVSGGVKRSRGVASMILGVPVQDHVEGLPNVGLTRVTRAEASPTPEAAALVEAQARATRSSAIGPLAQPQLTPWMREIVEQYFGAERDPRASPQAHR